MDATVVSKTTFEIDGIPGYRIEKLLDQGGMGGVYLAFDENLKRFVAIKVIHPEFTKNSDYIKRFTREALIVAGFQHVNIVTVYASGWQSDKQYLVMEYVPGGTLSGRMQRGRLEEPVAARIASQMADALAYAHQRGVIHRDFKPGNILLRENGTPVLSDFGIAKSDVTMGGNKTEVGIVMGNRRYMAPEQALGEAISNRVDVYSFGLVLFEMLTGNLPERHPVRTKQDAEEINASVRSDLGELISRCLSSEPSARPSASDCRDSLGSRATRPEGFWFKGRLSLIVGVTMAAAAGGFIWRNGVLVDHSDSAHIAPRANSPTSPAAIRGDFQVLTVQRLPPSAKVFVDGNEIPDAATDLPVGDHELVAVANGYYGNIRHVTSEGGTGSRAVSFALEPTSLPSAAEQDRFLKLADAKTLTEGDLSSVEDRTFRTALRAKLLSQTGRVADLEKLTIEVDTLRRYGDSRAAVAALLIDGVEAGRISRSLATQSLVAASDGGDAMASLYLAVTYRESLNASTTTVAASDSRFKNYCRRMELAAAQGWEDVALEYWRRDRCTG
jgi:serine/threonine protein kinase